MAFSDSGFIHDYEVARGFRLRARCFNLRRGGIRGAQVKYLAALVAGLHPIIWARGWELYESLFSRKGPEPASLVTGSGSLSDAVLIRKGGTWRAM